MATLKHLAFSLLSRFQHFQINGSIHSFAPTQMNKLKWCKTVSMVYCWNCPLSLMHTKPSYPNSLMRTWITHLKHHSEENAGNAFSTLHSWFFWFDQSVQNMVTDRCHVNHTYMTPTSSLLNSRESSSLSRQETQTWIKVLNENNKPAELTLE